MSKISVLGAGGWGLALSLAALRSGNRVTVWSPFKNEVEALLTTRESRLLSGVKIPLEVEITDDLSKTVGSDITIIATPSIAVRETAARLKNLDCGIIVNVSKGIEYGTLYTLLQVIEEELPNAKTAVLSGPSHAEEVAREIETSLVASSTDRKTAETVQTLLSSDKLRIYTNDDTVGVELGGAFKNIIAIAVGICDGMNLGDNTRAALMTRGLTEIARLGTRMGARDSTFAGLTGMGDLIVTCVSRHSRNRRFGELLGKGVPVEDALAAVGTVEGYHAVKAAYALQQEYYTDLPIIGLCYKIMYEGLSASDAVRALMDRPNRKETDQSWIR